MQKTDWCQQLNETRQRAFKGGERIEVGKLTLLREQLERLIADGIGLDEARAQLSQGGSDGR